MQASEWILSDPADPVPLRLFWRRGPSSPPIPYAMIPIPLKETPIFQTQQALRIRQLPSIQIAPFRIWSSGGPALSPFQGSPAVIYIRSCWRKSCPSSDMLSPESVNDVIDRWFRSFTVGRRPLRNSSLSVASASA